MVNKYLYGYSTVPYTKYTKVITRLYTGTRGSIYGSYSTVYSVLPYCTVPGSGIHGIIYPGPGPSVRRYGKKKKR